MPCQRKLAVWPWPPGPVPGYLHGGRARRAYLAAELIVITR
jgi:hypothetical protein